MTIQTEIRLHLNSVVSNYLDDELFDTLKLYETFAENEPVLLMREMLRAEIARRGLKSGGTL